MTTGLVLSCVLSALLGSWWGRWTLSRELTLYSGDRATRGAHEVAGRFWYLVPEGEYVHRYRDNGWAIPGEYQS